METTGFELVITSDKEEINIGGDNIDSVEFLVDTIDENVKDRSENVMNKVTIKGKITPELKVETRKLLIWSLSKRSEEIYRKVEVTIRVNETNRVRKYVMNKVFCLDYKETFNNGGRDSEYELKFSQRKDNLKEIEIIS